MRCMSLGLPRTFTLRGCQSERRKPTNRDKKPNSGGVSNPGSGATSPLLGIVLQDILVSSGISLSLSWASVTCRQRFPTNGYDQEEYQQRLFKKLFIQ